MSSTREPLQNFNLETMSGIYPGSRTMIYQRLRLHSADATKAQWYRLHWTEEPAAAQLYPKEDTQSPAAPTITLTDPHRPDFVYRFHEALSQAGLVADACFACHHWQPQPALSEDGLPTGGCGWRGITDTPSAPIPDALVTQSALSLACDRFQRTNVMPPRQTSLTTPSISQQRIQKSAELDPDRLPFWSRMWHHLRQRLRQNKVPRQHWADQIVERSGVGAGTEPCFACQGRLANLGAIAVASNEGDKQTFSVWRCRSCYTLYLNDWIDRWERLENLETEERYFRLAPAEAYAALAIIHATVGGEHPGRRQDRHPQRAQMLALVAERSPLSHQIRQGR